MLFTFIIIPSVCVCEGGGGGRGREREIISLLDLM